MSKLQTPQHRSARSFLRVAGPIIGGIGFIFVLIGVISFFAAFLRVPYRFDIIPIYVIVLIIAVRYCNRRQTAIRRQETEPPPIRESVK